MIPDITEEGLLPVGIHPTNWAEIENRYGTNFHRKRLLSGLNSALINLKKAGCKKIYIDGSFITDKEIPSDIDCCYEPLNINWLLIDPVFLDFDNLRAAQKAKYSCEFFPSSNKADLIGNTFLTFFQIDKISGNAKGIISLDLENFNNDKK